MMTRLDKFIALRRSRSFAVMSDGELTTLAEMVKERTFAPNATVCEPDKPLEMLYVVISGKVQRESGAPAPDCFGAASLLFGLPVRERLIAASDDGVRCLVIRRPHFFTMLRQFPRFLSPLLEMPNELLEVAPLDVAVERDTP